MIKPFFGLLQAQGSPQIISVYIYTSTSVDKDRSNSQDLQNPQHPIPPGTKSKQTNKQTNKQNPQFISSCCVTVPYQNLIDLFSHFLLSFIGMKRSFERHWHLQRKRWKIYLWHRALHQIQLDSEWRSRARCAGPENLKNRQHFWAKQRGSMATVKLISKYQKVGPGREWGGNLPYVGWDACYQDHQKWVHVARNLGPVHLCLFRNWIFENCLWRRSL